MYTEAQAKQLLIEEKFSQAITAYTKLIGVTPMHLPVHLGMITAFIGAQRYPEAQAALEEALNCWPDQADLAFLAADLLTRQGQLAQAEKILRFNLEQHPKHLPSRQNLGYLLFQNGQFASAALVHGETLRNFNNHIPAWRDFAQALIAAGHEEEGFNTLSEAIKFFPKDRETRFAYSLAALRVERWSEAWPSYEARWLPGELATRVPHGYTLWQGEALAPEQTLVVLSEQGFGDNLLFARYLPHLLEHQATKVHYQTHPVLTRLIQHSFPNLTVSEQLPPQRHSSLQNARPDVCVPIGSLPLRLASTHPHPPNAIAYLVPTPQGEENLLQVLAQLPAPPIALCWRGSQNIQIDQRSTELADLLTHIPKTQRGFPLISLQKNPSATEQAQLEKWGILDFSPLLHDFNATALILKHVHTLISVDTAVVNLAGALGTTVLLLRPAQGDWRWPAKQSRSPWYPSVTWHTTP